MRVGLISDTHANLDALLAVRASLEEHEVDRVYCLGDTVGYGGFPNECCQIVRSLTTATVLGNHDAAVSGRMNYDYYYDSARNVLDHHSRILTPDNMAWLRDIPYTRRIPELDILLTHGSPLHPENFDYIFEMDHVQKLFSIIDRLPMVTFLGHSHLCKVYVVEDYEVHEMPERDFMYRADGSHYIVSVGSVGQPRDLDNRACWVLLDTENRRITFVRAEYDIESAGDRISESRGDPNFAMRLILGW
jgi:diadenosine tetraphosphatase ApaH/serine/threonine PP2A family protein phosphatase